MEKYLRYQPERPGRHAAGAHHKRVAVLPLGVSDEGHSSVKRAAARAAQYPEAETGGGPAAHFAKPVFTPAAWLLRPVPAEEELVYKRKLSPRQAGYRHGAQQLEQPEPHQLRQRKSHKPQHAEL